MPLRIGSVCYYKIRGVRGVKNFRTFELRFGSANCAFFPEFCIGGITPKKLVSQIRKTSALLRVFFHGFSSYTLNKPVFVANRC